LHVYLFNFCILKVTRVFRDSLDGVHIIFRQRMKDKRQTAKGKRFSTVPCRNQF
jgi:hypothetical protein